MRKINHRDLEQFIGQVCDCDDYLQLKIAGYYPNYNNITVAARRGEDVFKVYPRGPKTDLSEAVQLDSRYLVIGDISTISDKILNACTLQKITDTWMQLPDNLFTSRLLIAGAARIIVTTTVPPQVAQTPEYQQAILDRRIIDLTCAP